MNADIHDLDYIRLHTISTKYLVDELLQREGVEHCRVNPYHPYEIAVVDDLKANKDHAGAGWSHGPMFTGQETGPAIIIVVID